MATMNAHFDSRTPDIKESICALPPITGNEAKTVAEFLAVLQDPRARAMRLFHADHYALIASAAGSSTKHQAWAGGYLDHLAECFRLASKLYSALSEIRPLPFTLSSALIVLYFHDIEKPWKYGQGSPGEIDKESFLAQGLGRYGIVFTPEERNALHYVHGEPDAEYNPKIRLMGRLAAFCHAVDTISARIWFDQGKGEG